MNWFAWVLSVVAPSRADRAFQRQALIGRALDHALERIAGVPPLAGRACTPADALLAVKASSYACGPVAREAEAWLTAAGVRGIEFHSLKAHYVLRDARTTLLHDIECPQGCASKEQLPIWLREAELLAMRDVANQDGTALSGVLERYAAQWLQRRVAPARATSPSA